MTKGDTAGVIAPPPLIFIGFLLAGFGLDALIDAPGMFAPETGVGLALRWGLPSLLLVLALYFLIGALARFRQAQTPPQPWQPTTAIVSSGVYGLTRNPMYLGMAMLYAAIAFAADNALALAMLIPALIVMEFGVIRREERYLEAKFGEDYRRYKASVRRWI